MLLPILAFVLIAAMAGAAAFGSVSLPAGSVWEVARAHATGTPVQDPLLDQILWDIRFPRVLLAAAVGAALSVAGVAFQALVRNPLADPFVLGVAAGASLGAVLVISYGTAVIAVGVTGSAFVFAMAATGLVFLMAQRSGRLADSRLILAGVAMAYLFTAGTSYVQLSSKPGQLQGIMFWLMGSLAGVQWSDLGLTTVLITVCSAWLLLQGRALNAMSAGDDAALGLGVNVHRLRIALLIVGSLLTATVVSVAGGIGFVGLIIPHITRMLVGSDHRRVLPISMAVGAIFMVLVDLGARTLDSPSELPIGILTAAIGAPFFLYLLRRKAPS